LKTNKPFIIIGAGGHAKVVADLILLAGGDIVGFVDKDPQRQGEQLLGFPVLGDDSVIQAYAPSDIQLAMGLGAGGEDLIAALLLRQKIFNSLSDQGYLFPCLIHPGATIAREVEIADAAQVVAGCVIEVGSQIDQLAIVNTSAHINHDCKVSKAVHIGPGTTVGGGVEIGQAAYIGLGTSIIHGLSIGEKSIVGAGSVVVNNVKANDKVFGVPARN